MSNDVRISIEDAREWLDVAKWIYANRLSERLKEPAKRLRDAIRYAEEPEEHEPSCACGQCLEAEAEDKRDHEWAHSASRLG